MTTAAEDLSKALAAASEKLAVAITAHAISLRHGLRELADTLNHQGAPRDGQNGPQAAQQPPPGARVHPGGSQAAKTAHSDTAATETHRDEWGPLFCWCGAPTTKRMIGRRADRYCRKDAAHDPENPPDKPGTQTTPVTVSVDTDELHEWGAGELDELPSPAVVLPRWRGLPRWKTESGRWMRIDGGGPSKSSEDIAPARLLWTPEAGQ